MLLVLLSSLCIPLPFHLRRTSKLVLSHTEKGPHFYISFTSHILLSCFSLSLLVSTLVAERATPVGLAPVLTCPETVDNCAQPTAVVRDVSVCADNFQYFTVVYYLRHVFTGSFTSPPFFSSTSSQWRTTSTTTWAATQSHL